MKKSRFCALVLALVMLFYTLPATAAEASSPLLPKVRDYPGFADVKGTWCETAVKTVYEAGLMSGKSDGRFDAKGAFSYEHALYACAKLLNRLTGGTGTLRAAAPGQQWYTPGLDYLSTELPKRGATLPDVYTNKSFMDTASHQSCERMYFTELLGAILTATNITLPEINTVTVIPDAGDDGNGFFFYPFYRAGILRGSDQYGYCGVYSPINRGEAAAILARILDPAQRLTFTLVPFDLCRNVFKIEPETVFLTVDGVAVRAEQMAYPLCNRLREMYYAFLCNGPAENIPSKAVDGAVMDMAKDIAMERLAGEKGITYTTADVEAAFRFKEATLHDGVGGQTVAGRMWQYQHLYIYQQLYDLYAQSYPTGGFQQDDFAEYALRDDLDAIVATMNIQRTAALTGLDPKQLERNLLNTPFLKDTYPPIFASVK